MKGIIAMKDDDQRFVVQAVNFSKAICVRPITRIARLRELRRSMHQPIPQQGRWLQQVVTGYFNYHAVPTNSSTLTAFLFHVTNLWRRTLRQRSQKDLKPPRHISTLPKAPF